MKVLKILASFAVAAGLLWACDKPAEEVVPVIEGEIELTSDVDQLRSDGVDAVTFKVSVTDAQGAVHDVTEHAEIYLNYDHCHQRCAGTPCRSSGIQCLIQTQDAPGTAYRCDMFELSAHDGKSEETFRGCSI